MSVLYTKAIRMMKSATAMSHISSKTEADVSKRVMLVTDIKNTEIFPKQDLFGVQVPGSCDGTKWLATMRSDFAGEW